MEMPVYLRIKDDVVINREVWDEETILSAPIADGEVLQRVEEDAFIGSERDEIADALERDDDGIDAELEAILAGE